MERVRFARVALFVFALSFLFVLFGPALFAQAPTGTLTGTTLDPSGAAIVGADIKVVDTATPGRGGLNSAWCFDSLLQVNPIPPRIRHTRLGESISTAIVHHRGTGRSVDIHCSTVATDLALNGYQSQVGWNRF